MLDWLNTNTSTTTPRAFNRSTSSASPVGGAPAHADDRQLATPRSGGKGMHGKENWKKAIVKMLAVGKLQKGEAKLDSYLVRSDAL